MKRLVTLLLTVIPLALPQLATADDETMFTQYFTVYGLHPGDYSDIRYQGADGKLMELNFKRKSRSLTYEAKILRADPVLRFFRSTNSGSATEVKEIAHLRLNKSAYKLLLIFLPEKAAKDVALRILPIEEGTQQSLAGTVRIFNLAGVTLYGLVENERFRLEHLECGQPINLGKDNRGEFSIVAEGSTRYHLVYKNELKVDDESQALLFLTPPYRKGSLRIGGHLLNEEIPDN